MSTNNVGFTADLGAKHLKVKRPHIARQVRVPGIGRILFTRDPGNARFLSTDFFATNLYGIHTDGDGQVVNEYDFGSGQVTNVGVLALANDYAWADVSGTPIQTLGPTMKYVAVGTGTGAEAATSIQLGT